MGRWGWCPEARSIVRVCVCVCRWGGVYHLYVLHYIILYHVYLCNDQLLYEYMTCLVSCIGINGCEVRYILMFGAHNHACIVYSSFSLMKCCTYKLLMIISNCSMLVNAVDVFVNLHY
jgi:hypothetical protein